MTSKNNVEPEGDDSLGVLDDTTSSDTIAIGLHEGTAQVSVALPTGGEEDDLVDDEVIGGEVVSDLIIDTSAVADADVLARISQDAPDIVIELPAEELPAEAETVEATPVDPETVTEVVVEAEEPGIEGADVAADADDIVDADVVPEIGGADAEVVADGDDEIVADAGEDADVTIPKDFDPGAIRLTGNVAGAPPFHGVLRHHGWRVSGLNLPRPTGGVMDASVLAPAEVEVR